MQETATTAPTTENSPWENSRVEWVEVESLVVDKSYQRDLEPRKVSKIVKDFDPDAFGTLAVSIRVDGTRAVIDGGHRTAALREMGWNDQQVEAVVYRGLSLEREAQIFATLNSNRTKPKPVEIFRAEVLAGNPTSAAINQVFTKYGLVPTQSIIKDGIRAIGTCQRIVKGGSIELLDNVLSTIVRAYGADKHPARFNHDFMIPLAAIIQSNNDVIDLARLARVINGLGEPATIVARGKTVSSVSGSRLHNEVANLVIRKYNLNLRTNTLDEFGSTKIIFTTR